VHRLEDEQAAQLALIKLQLPEQFPAVVLKNNPEPQPVQTPAFVQLVQLPVIFMQLVQLVDVLFMKKPF
jgi:hypothetical protein